MVDFSSNKVCVCVCVVGLQNWMRWCLVTSSRYSPPDWPAQSWQRGSRATATCCPSVDASNTPTLKTRALEGREITSLYYLILYILSFPSLITSTWLWEARNCLYSHTCPLVIPAFLPPFCFVLVQCCMLLIEVQRSPLHTDKYTREGVLDYNSRYG